MTGERRETRPMDTDSFGSCLRRARELRQLSLRDVAGTTKIPRSTLEQIESSNIADLPADVFVRGFIRSFARAVGTDASEPLHGFERALNARRDAERARSSTPTVDPAVVAAGSDDEASMPRRGLGLAVFVIILLLIATITLSLLLRRPPQSGEGLSQAMPRPVPGAPLDHATL
jgi:cytoskeletal protein RodZ